MCLAQRRRMKDINVELAPDVIGCRQKHTWAFFYGEERKCLIHFINADNFFEKYYLRQNPYTVICKWSLTFISNRYFALVFQHHSRSIYTIWYCPHHFEGEREIDVCAYIEIYRTYRDVDNLWSVYNTLDQWFCFE